MKKVNFFAMLAAAALMSGVSSCSNDDNVGEVPDNGDATLVIKLPSNVVGTGSRAIEDPVAGGSNAKTPLKNVSVFMLNAGAVIDTCTFTSDEMRDGYKRIEQVAATINRVIVVANIPTAADSTALYGYSNAAAILSHPYSTASQNAEGGIANKVLVGDTITIAGATDPGTSDPNHAPGHTYMEANVTLDALTARFEIGTVRNGTGVAEVELLGVWINKFYKDGSRKIAEVINKASTDTCWVTDPLTFPGGGSELRAGWGNSVTMGPWDELEYHNVADTAAVKLEANSKVYAYQVFAGENIPQLILLVRGKYATGYFNDATDQYFFGYVTFTKFIDGNNGEIAKVEANTIYKIGVGTTGIVITPDIITPKPNLKDIDLGIKVKVAPWTEKTVTPSV